MRRPRQAAIVAALAALSTQVQAQLCCVNTTSSETFESSCQCLNDNIPLTRQQPGVVSLYHWVFNSASESLLESDPRGTVTFEVQPCSGSATLSVESASPDSWPHIEALESSTESDINSVTLPVTYSEHALFVSATEGSKFEVAAYTSLVTRPVPGGEGAIQINVTSTGQVEVGFNATELASASETRYKAYWVEAPMWEPTPSEAVPTECVTFADGSSPQSNPNCLFWTACGIDALATGASSWTTVEAGSEGMLTVEGLGDGGVENYLMNIVMEDAEGRTAAYVTTGVSLTTLAYQECVADASCESQSVDNSMLQITVWLVIAFFIALVGVMTRSQRRMNYQIQVASKKIQNTRIANSGAGESRGASGGSRSPTNQPLLGSSRRAPQSGG
ncbi:unnamed protein product [Chrysoparadoxa australica]